MSSPLAGVLLQVLPALDGKVFDYASDDDFERLWAFKGLPQDRILIVWDDTAHDGSLPTINTAASLSPVDWALAYVAQSMKPPRDWPEVLILDLQPTVRSAPSLAHIEMLRPDQLPWMQVMDSATLSTIVGWFSPKAPRAEDACREALNRFLAEVRWNLTQTKPGVEYDHHAIANIVGPMILLGRPVKHSLHLSALQRLLECCEISQPWSPDISQPVAGDSEVGAVRSPGGEKGMARQSEDDLTQSLGSQRDKDDKGIDHIDAADVGVLLMDDMEHYGWSDWVKSCLPGCSFFAHRDPTELVSAVKDQLVGANSSDLRFRLKLPGVDKPKSVLLLDLRLFSGNFDGEKAFYKDALLPLIIEKFLSDKTGLTWPGFDDADKGFTLARRAVENGKLEYESAEHREALTWLPRVLALADLSMPIVLFSSTDRKANVAPLLPYKNIFVAFQKPSLSALRDVELRTATRTRFLKAMRSAIAYAELRKKCRDIERLAGTVKFKSKDVAAEGMHIELYLDESGKADQPDFCVGGVFGVFQSLGDADLFDDVCVTKGLRYFKDVLFNPGSPNPLRKEQDNGQDKLASALNQFRTENQRDVAIGFVKLRRGDGAGSENLADERLWKLVSALVELFCAESVPAIAKQYKIAIEKITLSVYLGTRVVDCDEEGQFAYRSYVEIHALGEHGDKNMLRSVNGRDAFPIVRRALSQHAPLDKLDVERAIAVCLPYEGSMKPRFDRVIHRPSKAVYGFDHMKDIEVPAPTAGCTVYGKIDSIVRPALQFMFVKVVGLPRGVFCHTSQCRFNLAQRSEGEYVSFNLTTNNQGFAGDDVKLVAESEYFVWVGAQLRTVSSRFLRGKPVDEYRPDYRALHYIADQALSRNGLAPFDSDIPSYSVSSEVVNAVVGQIDDDFDLAMESDLLASRALDAELLSNALAVFVAADILRKTQRPSARALVASRLWAALMTCKGDVLSGAFPIHVAAATRPPRREGSGYKRARADGRTQDAVSHPGPADRVQQTARIGPAQARLEALGKKWLIKRFDKTGTYNENWHEKDGFYVRTTSQGTKLVVFADLAQVARELKESLPSSGFKVPDQANLFGEDGGPCGRKYQPPRS